MDRVKKVFSGLRNLSVAEGEERRAAENKRDSDISSPDSEESDGTGSGKASGEMQAAGFATAAVASASKSKSESNSKASPSSSGIGETGGAKRPTQPTAQATGTRKHSKAHVSTNDKAVASKQQQSSVTTTPCSRRLLREFQDVVRNGEIECSLIDDNLHEWEVQLTRIDPDSQLHKDMKSTGIPAITLNILFPQKYPFSPPFMRVVKPCIIGGYVMEGGAICMELLTAEGWSAAYTAESIVRQFAASLVAGKARLCQQSKSRLAYTQANAEQSFKHVVKVHQARGWFTPPKEKG
eukprot:scpid76900/ scgid29331/ Ubiquitin-conjugating enzyme E2Q-like protein CG4502